MAENRDEFSSVVKENLAKRAGQRCSNPSCGLATSGPHNDESKAINVGVAAHITAASPGGPRYNKSFTSEDRSAATNAIWLCQKCAKLIDSDVKEYSEELILRWKRQHEAAIRAEIEGTPRFADSTRLPAQLSVDAVFQYPTNDNKACVLDIRVSNPGGSDLMINAVQIETLESIEQMLLGHAEYSAQYDLDIGKMRNYASREECQVAQILRPGEADRFAIILSDPNAHPTVGGWRFATQFKTNVGSVPGPEIEVWLPRPKVVRSIDEVAGFWLRKAHAQNFITGKEFKKLATYPFVAGSPDAIEYSKFMDTGGGAFAYPSTTTGYETFVVYDVTIGFYRGPGPLWERPFKQHDTVFSEPEVEAAKTVLQMYGPDAPEKVELAIKEFTEQGNAKGAANWKQVLEHLKKKGSKII